MPNQTMNTCRSCNRDEERFDADTTRPIVLDADGLCAACRDAEAEIAASIVVEKPDPGFENQPRVQWKQMFQRVQTSKDGRFRIREVPGGWRLYERVGQQWQARSEHALRSTAWEAADAIAFPKPKPAPTREAALITALEDGLGPVAVDGDAFDPEQPLPAQDRRYKVNFYDDNRGPVPNRIQMFLHCRQCLDEWKAGKAVVDGQRVSPREWARLEVGWTVDGFQVRCVRHDLNVVATTVRAVLRKE